MREHAVNCVTRGNEERRTGTWARKKLSSCDEEREWYLRRVSVFTRACRTSERGILADSVHVERSPRRAQQVCVLAGSADEVVKLGCRLVGDRAGSEERESVLEARLM